ncbi:MAG TPA: nucleotidyltransferase domain-containing protein [Ignavibacteria bacterium]|nr:nucleotidyltransferase domain-containing protein [Ignavibacteria bacterium]
MVINNVLNSMLSNKSCLKVLRVLNGLAVGISGRETSRLAQISLRAAQIALRELESLHIVNKQFGNRENLFSLNRNNYLVKNIITLIFKEENNFKKKIFKIITGQLKDLTESIVLFGSAARLEETVRSDLDVCIVYSKNKREINRIISSISDKLYKEFGVLLAPFFITKKEFISRAKKRKPPLNNLLTEGKVLSGLSINRLMNEK